MGGELWCGQAQNGVNWDFQVKFDLEGQGRSVHKTMGILTKVFCIFGPSLVILAWTGPELLRGQTSDWHTDRQTDRQTDRLTDRQTHTQTHTDEGNDNTRRPKLASGEKRYRPIAFGSLELIIKDICIFCCPACRTSLIATRFWVVVICPIIKCLTVLEFSFLLFDLCLFITIFNFILNYVPIVTFWISTYHKIRILLIIFCFIWNYWIIYFVTCLEVFWSVVS